MLKSLALALSMTAALGAAMLPGSAHAADREAKQVTVYGRQWIVTPTKSALKGKHPGQYRATRLNTELLPFRPPAVLSARQAAEAFQAATGCRPGENRMVRSISGDYYTTMTCPGL